MNPSTDQVLHLTRPTLNALWEVVRGEDITIPRAFRLLAGMFVKDVRPARPDVLGPVRDHIEVWVPPRTMRQIEATARDLGLDTDLIAEMVIQSTVSTWRARPVAA